MNSKVADACKRDDPGGSFKSMLMGAVGAALTR